MSGRDLPPELERFRLEVATLEKKIAADVLALHTAGFSIDEIVSLLSEKYERDLTSYLIKENIATKPNPLN